MARRTGISSINKIAKEMCRLVTTFTPIIQRIYPENVALLAALDAANAACALLVVESENALEFGD